MLIDNQPGRLQECAVSFVRWSKILFTPAALAAVCYFAVVNYENLKRVIAEGRPAWLFAAVGCWCLVNLLLPLVSARLSCLRPGSPLDYPAALKVHVTRLPAKYLPGGIWHTAARAADYRNLGITRGDLAAILVLEHVLALAITAGAGGLGLYLLNPEQVWAISGLAAALLSAVTFAVLLLLAVKRARLAAVIYFMQAVGTHFAAWMLAALAFLAYVLAFPSLGLPHDHWYIMASYLFAWAVGFLAFFSPQGVGVFEVTISELIVGGDSLLSMAVLMAGFRLVILLGDAAVWLSYYLWRNRQIERWA